MGSHSSFLNKGLTFENDHLAVVPEIYSLGRHETSSIRRPLKYKVKNLTFVKSSPELQHFYISVRNQGYDSLSTVGESETHRFKKHALVGGKVKIHTKSVGLPSPLSCIRRGCR